MVFFDKIVGDTRKIWVRKLTEQLRLQLELPDSANAFIRSELAFRHLLDGNCSVQSSIARAIDCTHSAPAHDLQNLISVPENRAFFKPLARQGYLHNPQDTELGLY